SLRVEFPRVLRRLFFLDFARDGARLRSKTSRGQAMDVKPAPHPSPKGSGGGTEGLAVLRRLTSP
ncbi:MAG: hypothetical protein ACKO9V_06495, partial [Candidatus Kapaibacterium sp.]